MLLTLHDPNRARRFYQQGWWRSDTLYGLLARHASERPNAYALRDSKHRLIWRQLKDWVDAVAHDLDQAEIPPGGRVSIWLPNRVESVVTFLSCSRNGYVCNSSLHQNYTVAEIVDLLRGIQSSALVTQAGYGANGQAQDIFALAGELPAMKRVYQAPQGINGLTGWPRPEVMAQGHPGWARLSPCLARWPRARAAPILPRSPSPIQTKSSISPLHRAPRASPRA